MASTFSQHYLEKAQKWGDSKVALRQKEFGIWREYSWQESYNEVRLLALGLAEIGMQRGDKVSAIGDNDRQYLWGYLAVLSNGGTMIGLYTDANPVEAAYVVDHSDSAFVLAQDQEQVDKMIEIRDKIPQVQKVIYWNDSGLWDYNDDWLISYDTVRDLGRKVLEREPTRFEDEIAKGHSDDLALICYTSGTTGLPKGAMLSHRALLEAARIFNDIDPRLDTDNHVSFLPMGWIAEHIIGVASHCFYGLIVNFPEEPETVQANIREIAPDMIVYNSRLWDNIVSLIQVRMGDASWLNRQFNRIFLPIGNRAADRKLRGQALGPGLSASYWIGDKLFFGPLRDSLGLSNVRTAITGGAALSPDVIRFFHAMGVNLKQIYGMTEVATTGTGHRNGDIKFASVGPAAPGVDIRIGDKDEIQIASPTLFDGYYKNPEKTAEDVLLDETGKRWFRTGDAGYIDDDEHLIYLDRVKDMIELSSGTRFSPQFIEGRLKFSPFVKDVMAIGDPSRDNVTAMVIFEFDNVARWAEKLGLGFTTFADLSQKPEVLALIKDAVIEVNENLPPEGQVVAFTLMPKEFDADESEMTRSRKLKRQVLADKYIDIITGLYGSAEKIIARSEVTYQDGTVGTLENELTIVKV